MRAYIDAATVRRTIARRGDVACVPGSSDATRTRRTAAVRSGGEIATHQEDTQR